MVLKVDPLRVGWLGIVIGVRAPSIFSRTMAIWFSSRTTRKQSRSNVLPSGWAHPQGIGASHGYLSFRNECLKNRRFGIDFVQSECFDMKFNG